MSPPKFRLTAAEPKELDVHEACARALDALLLPPAMWFTYPAGLVKLSAPQMARYSAAGLRRGLPDIWVLYRGAWCIELKRRSGRLSKTRVARTRRGSPRILDGQEDVFPRLLASGGVNEIAVCHSVEEVLTQIERWGIPLRARITA